VAPRASTSRYAYAIENVLKGLIVSKRPDLVQKDKLHGELKTHDLIKLAKKAKVTVEEHERPVLKALSELSISAGRYPVALEPSWPPDPNALLGWGSAHPIMRTFFERAYKELESRVPQQFPRFGKVLVCR
jgi:hypothetical protein